MLYLLHFDPRYLHAGHYLGYTQDLMKRFNLHLRGKGSPLVRAAVKNGSKVVLVRLWNEDGNAEQEIKRVVGSRARLCPVCNPKAIDVMKAYRSALVHLASVEQVQEALKSLSDDLKETSRSRVDVVRWAKEIRPSHLA
jgi:predicted GIY-YIG superfamily endonuclease